MCYTTSSVPQMLVNCLATIPIILLGQGLAQMAAGQYLGVVSVSCWLPWPMIAVWPLVTPCTTQYAWGPDFVACWLGPHGLQASC